MTAQGPVVAFYGLADAKAAASFYEDTLQWFQANDCPPDKLSVAGEGFSGKPTAFNRTHGRLMKGGFQGIDSVTVLSMCPDSSLPLTDWRMTAILSLKDSYVVLAADSSVASMDSMLSVARTTVEHLKPCYGIGYVREMRLGPSLYAIGLNYGTHTAFSGPEYEEKLRITRWGEAMGQHAYRDGFVRDVYPCNFLTNPQLSRSVAGASLHDWITHDASRGQLTEFAGDVFLWSVDEAVIQPVRDVLHREGVIYDAQVA